MPLFGYNSDEIMQTPWYTVSNADAIASPALLVYPFFTLTSRAMQTYIVEWHSPDFHDPRFLPFAAMLRPMS